MPELYDPIKWLEYDKITDDVYTIASNLALRFSVSLSHADKNKHRSHFYKEYEYDSKYNGINSLVTIRRSYEYYLSIENITKREEDTQRMIIRITPQEFILVKNGLENAVNWFNDKKYAKLYIRAKGKLALNDSIPSYTISGLQYGNTITLMPTIVTRGNDDRDSIPGVLMQLPNNQQVEITLDKFMGLYYIYSTFNMFQSAQIMVGFMGIPAPGTNRTNLASGTPRSHRVIKDNTKDSEITTGPVGRKPKRKYNSISSLEGD